MAGLRRTLCVITVLAVLAGCDRSPPAADPKTGRATETPEPVVNVEWSKYVDEFVDSYFRAHPSFAVTSGKHEFDGQLPDWSKDGIQKEIVRLEQMRERAIGFKDDNLEPEERFQRDYVVSRIDNDLFSLRDARQPFTNPAWYFDSGLDPSTYVTTPYAPSDQRARAFIAYVKQVPAALDQIKANLQLPLPRSFIDFSVASFGGFVDFYRNDVPQAFSDIPDDLKKELTAAIEPAAVAMDDFAKWLESQRATANDNYALGPERFAAMLRMTENVDVPLKKIEEIGRADLERNLSALNEACKAFAPGAKIEECVARVGADKPDGGAVVGARAQLETIKKYILDHDIVSIPGTEEAKVEEAPAYRRQNFAYINIPGPFEKELPSVYYIAPPDPKWSKAEQDAYVPGKADLLFTSIHEVWPGHFLQFLHSNRSPWRFGQLFVGYAYAEGWAHYSEELMIEHGIAATEPELHIGQLLNALLRNVRYMCAIGLHTQGMTVLQCEQMFKDKAFQDAGNARQQAARGTYDPGYLNYTLGKLMIRKLRDDWSSSRGGREAWKLFNDDFLSYGGPPIPLVRSQMMPGPAGDLF